MYIVSRGRLQVVADNGKTILATLRPGSYFGEISILNMGNAGNRRTASVRSMGFSDLFCLNKKDLWDVLKDYPTARVRLEAIAQKRLENYKKPPLDKGNMAVDAQGRYAPPSCSHFAQFVVELFSQQLFATGKIDLENKIRMHNNKMLN